MSPTHYVVEVEPETCRACGLCMRRCPVDALQLKFSPKAKNKFRKAVEIDPDLCIGCGVCVHKCKSKSIVLVLREGDRNMPENYQDWGMRHLADLQAARENS
ncbi:MAG: 4Fe-4S dicluster domain-containing protein [Proteobacteria bacterium]|nr:4Fe-4S dicluster domain-containing protein [Pseudomonadota bacterium]